MPRSLKEILDQADHLADRFEDCNTDPANVKDAVALRVLRAAFQARVKAEANLADAVTSARAEGHPWAAIGAMIGTSGEAARQRYGMSGTPSDLLVLLKDGNAEMLSQAMDKLPKDCRSLLLALASDPPLSYGEIASRLNISLGAIGPTRTRCLDRLRRSIDEIRRHDRDDLG